MKSSTEHNQGVLIPIIMPCRNEESFCHTVAVSILNCDLDKTSYELLIVDGVSHDETREITLVFMHGLVNARLLDNLHQTVPFALNLSIKKQREAILAGWMP